jgi:heme exporter protein C
MNRHLPTVLLLVAVPLLLYSIMRIFGVDADGHFFTPIEQKMGTVQKIFYFHVPLAWIMMALGVACGVAAGIQLRRQSKLAEATSIACAELVLITGLGVLITGPIWGHATWGRAWTWDARQVTTGLLWLVFAAYVLVRRYGAAGSDRLAAALAIFGAVDVPIIYYAVKIWKTTHPSTDVVGSLPSNMWTTLWWSLSGLVAVAVALLLTRIRQEMTAIALDDAWIAFDERARAGKQAGGAA